MLTLTLIICGLALLALTVVVIYGNSKAAINRWLGSLSASGLVWLLANLFANHAVTVDVNLFFSRAALIGATLLPLTFIMFCLEFTGRHRLLNKKTRTALYLPVVFLLLTTPTSWNIKSVSVADGSIVPGISYPILLGLFIVYFSYGITILIKEYRNSEQERREQLRYILIGTAFTIVPSLTMSAILPLLGYSGGVGFAPAAVIFFVGFTAVAIIKHRLFDIKFYVVRAIAYFVTVLLLGPMYVAPAMYIILSVILGVPFVFGKFVFGVMFVTLIAIYFENLRAWLDKRTGKIFFRDRYDSAAVLGELNKILVSTIELDKLLHSSSSLISTTLKAEYCVFALNKTSIAEQRFIGTEIKHVSVVDMHKMREVQFEPGTNLVITDYLGEEQSELKAVLTKNNTAVLIRLSSNAMDSEEGLGYILLGYKKSGNGYSSKDAQALEAMADVLTIAIQNALHFEEIQKFNVTLQQRVENATSQLRRTNAKLKALDETKDDFMSMASHQLRTPLTAVKGYLSMVVEGDAGDLTPVQKKMLGQAFMSSQRMVFLISDLLNVSRLKTGKFVIEQTPINLANMISEEINQLREMAALRSLQLTYDKPKEFPTLMLDETKSRQVIMNYIDNAVHYTPKGGHIKIELRDRPHSVELRVTDDGIGVPRSEHHHLFTKFYRAANARRERPDGTGLGLFMAKKVIVAQGGAVIFESRENHGSTFGFTLPKAKLLVRPEK